MMSPSSLTSLRDRIGATALARHWPRVVRTGTRVLIALSLSLGCRDDTSGGGYTPVDPPVTPVTPVLTSIRLSFPTDTIEQNQVVAAHVEGLDQFGQAMTIGPVTLLSASSAVVVAGATTGLLVGVDAGTTTITAMADGLVARRDLTVAKSPVRINEVFTNANIPGGFVELINPTDRDIDLGGYSLATPDTLNVVPLPAGFILPAHGFLTVNEIRFPRGINVSDEMRLFSRFDALVDRVSWVGISATDFSRCPDLTGPFLPSLPTRRAANDCVDAQAAATIPAAVRASRDATTGHACDPPHRGASESRLVARFSECGIDPHSGKS
jgi:hypothetical protein